MRKVLDYLLALPLIVCAGIYLVVLAIIAVLSELRTGKPVQEWFDELSRGWEANDADYRQDGLRR